MPEHGYKFFITGVLLSVAHKQEKNYEGKIAPAHSVLNFVDVDEEGNMKPLKIKCLTPHTFKANDKVTCEVQYSAMESNVYFKALNIKKA